MTSGLQLGSAEVLRGLRNFLNMDRSEYHSINNLRERGVEKGSVRQSTFRGRERPVFNQTDIGTVSESLFVGLQQESISQEWIRFDMLPHCDESCRSKLHAVTSHRVLSPGPSTDSITPGLWQGCLQAVTFLSHFYDSAVS